MPTSHTNARMIIDNVVDNATATLTQGDAVATMPVDHLKVYNNSRIFRTTSDTFQITLELDKPQLINSLVLWRHNLLGNATVQIDLLDSNEQVLYASGELPVLETKKLIELKWAVDEIAATLFTDWRLAFSVFWFDQVFASKIVLTIKDLDNPLPRDITRLYIGQAIEPEYNFRWGKTIEWHDNAKGKPTAGGGSHHVESEVWREAKITLENITENDFPHLFEAFRKVSTQKDWFVSLHPQVGGQKERDHSFATKAQKPVRFKDDNSRFYSAAIDLREV